MEDIAHADSHLTQEYCTFCGDSFEDEASLNLHLKHFAATPSGLLAFDVEIMEIKDEIQKWAEYPAVCRFCSRRVVGKDALSEHCVEAHNQCFGSQCADCNNTVACFKDFVEHVKTHRPNLR